MTSVVVDCNQQHRRDKPYDLSHLRVHMTVTPPVTINDCLVWGWPCARMSNYNRPSQSTLRAEKDRNADYNTSLFRRMSWEGTVPLEIRVDPKELPANSDRGLECYFIQAPRISYLPLLVPEIKRFLMDVVFDETAAKSLKDEDWWFESEEGTLLKWYCSWNLHTRYLTNIAQALVNRSVIRQPYYQYFTSLPQSSFDIHVSTNATDPPSCGASKRQTVFVIYNRSLQASLYEPAQGSRFCSMGKY